MYSDLVSLEKPLIFPEIGLSGSGPPNDTVGDSGIIEVIRTSLPNVGRGAEPP